MLILTLKLAALILLLLPVLLVLWTSIHRRWSAPICETLLLSLVMVPVLLIAGIFLLGTVPPGRPLDWIGPLQLVVSLLAAGVVWQRRREAGQLCGGLAEGFTAVWRACPWVHRGIVALGLARLVSAAVYGFWTVPWAWDELSYHLPQALQPYQDGRLGAVECNVPWADSYPRGVELLYFWTFALMKSDAGFHPVNAGFAVIFVLATYTAARRVGLEAPWAAASACLVPTTPIFAHLCTIGYIDLCVASLMGAAIALGLPERGGGWTWNSCLACAAALLGGLWMKFSAVSVFTLLLLFHLVRILMASFAVRRPPPVERSGPGIAGLIVVATGIVAFSSPPYVRSWVKYGSPVYPLELKVMGWTVFPGPMTNARLTHLGDEPALRRFSEYWTNWHANVDADSAGGFGPLFTLAVVPASLWCFMRAVTGRRFAWLLLAASFWMVVFLPSHHLCRYALFILLPGCVFAARLGAHLPPGRFGGAWAGVLLLLQLWNVERYDRQALRGIRWMRGFGVPLMTEIRATPIRNRLVRMDDRSPSPATRAMIYEAMQRGEVLVSAVYGFQGLLYDPHYRYAVVHRPARRWAWTFDKCADLSFGRSHAEAWLEELRRAGVAAVLVYAGSSEDEVLRSRDSGFRLHYEQPAAEGACQVLLYRREARASPTTRRTGRSAEREAPGPAVCGFVRPAGAPGDPLATAAHAANLRDDSRP